MNKVIRLLLATIVVGAPLLSASTASADHGYYGRYGRGHYGGWGRGLGALDCSRGYGRYVGHFEGCGRVRGNQFVSIRVSNYYQPGHVPVDVGEYRSSVRVIGGKDIDDDTQIGDYDDDDTQIGTGKDYDDDDTQTGSGKDTDDDTQIGSGKDTDDTQVDDDDDDDDDDSDSYDNQDDSDSYGRRNYSDSYGNVYDNQDDSDSYGRRNYSDSYGNVYDDQNYGNVYGDDQDTGGQSGPFRRR